MYFKLDKNWTKTRDFTIIPLFSHLNSRYYTFLDWTKTRDYAIIPSFRKWTKIGQKSDRLDKNPRLYDYTVALKLDKNWTN